MIEIYGLNTEAMTAEVAYRRSRIARARAESRRPLPRASWLRRSTSGR